MAFTGTEMLKADKVLTVGQNGILPFQWGGTVFEPHRRYHGR